MPWRTLSSNLSVGLETDGWNLADINPEDLDKPRTFSVDIPFASPFVGAPVVHVGLTGFDMDQRHTSRISVRAADITPSGFRMEIATWMDSRIYSAEIAWLAIGA
jgi:hypothetical protein